MGSLYNTITDTTKVAKAILHSYIPQLKEEAEVPYITEKAQMMLAGHNGKGCGQIKTSAHQTIQNGTQAVGHQAVH